jgi:hypothetical protein
MASGTIIAFASYQLIPVRSRYASKWTYALTASNKWPNTAAVVVHLSLLYSAALLSGRDDDRPLSPSPDRPSASVGLRSMSVHPSPSIPRRRLGRRSETPSPIQALSDSRRVPRRGSVLPHRPAARSRQIGDRMPSGALVSKRNSVMTSRTSCTRSVTPSLRYKRLQCVWIVFDEMPRSAAIAKSVRSSNTLRTICSSRPDNLSEGPISAQTCSLNIVDRPACRPVESALPVLMALFTPPPDHAADISIGVLLDDTHSNHVCE